MSERVFNFSPGPATLPEPVIERAKDALWSLDGSGIGILEHSHRGPEFSRVIQQAEERCRGLVGISDDYAVLFLQGGASLQFSMVAMNLMPAGGTADYINTGAWSKKAIKEANKIGTANIAASSEDENFSYIPGTPRWSEAPAYCHFTSNNTIFGTQFEQEPEAPAPLVCDASSDIFSRPIDINRYGVLYAGAQKNLGPSGVVLVIMRKELAERAPDSLPTMLQYRTHIEAKSLFNTPPTFGIYVMGEVFAWIEEQGGLETVAANNAAKAALLYDFLDQSDFYAPTARADSRSLMNVCFRSPSAELDSRFVAEAKAEGLSGLKGHRSVGGMRASIYNAFPRAGVEKLVEFMKVFATKNG